MPHATITILSPTQTQITGDFDARGLDAHFAFSKGKFVWRNRAVQMGKWDGLTHMYRRASGTLPTGLYRDARKWLKAAGTTVTLVDPHGHLPALGDGAPRGLLADVELHGNEPGTMIKLRDYQVDAARRALAKGRGILHIATGGGKTELACSIVEALGRPTTLFLVGSRALAAETRQRFATRLGVPLNDVGMVGAGTWHEGPCGVTIAIVSSYRLPKHAVTRAAFNKRCEVLILDEAHHAGGAVWYRLAQTNRAKYRFGLTGTPVGRSDTADIYLRAVTGPVIARVSAKRLIKRGVLAVPTVVVCDITRPRIDLGGSSYMTIRKEGIVECENRNDLVVATARQLMSAGKKTLLLVREIAHGEMLEAMLGSHVATFLNGKHDSATQAEAIDGLVTGEIKILIATSIFDEGRDVPAIDGLILAGAGKAAIATMQRIGRGLRRKTKDNRLIVIDFSDRHNVVLAAHARARQAIYERESFAVHEVSGHIPALGPYLKRPEA